MGLFYSKDKKDTITPLKGSTLIIPSISIGNVPQLATDLLLHTHNFTKVASLDDDYLFPFASPIDYYDEPVNGISTSLELFYDTKLNVSIIQQRSPVIVNYEANFIEYLTAIIKDIGFKKVVILDSNESSVIIDQASNFEKPIEVYHNNEESSLIEKFKSLNLSQSTKSSKNITHFTPFVNELIHNLDDIVVNALVIFVYEGDNFNEARTLSSEVSSTILNLDPVREWRQPKSWRGVYGDRPIPLSLEEGIYG